MTILLGLTVRQLKVPDATPFVALTHITLNPFSRDRTLFDSGAAFGRDTAEIPLSGSGTEGETVQLRFLCEDGTATNWADVADIPTGGNWRATASHSRRANWIRPEVRIKSEPVTRALGANRFGVGHVVALWGQSEVVRIRSLAHDKIPPEQLLADDMMQTIWMDGAPVIKHLTDDDPHTAALAAMANVFLAERPDDKVAIVFHAVSGTGFRELVDDSNTGRSWLDDAALHAFATADGQHVGLPVVSWFASAGALAENYDDALFPLFTGKLLNGSPIGFPAQISYGASGSYTADHWFGELYDPAHTRWVPFGPHRFDITEDMQNATVTALGAMQENLSNKQDARVAWRNMVGNVHAGTWFLPSGLEPLAYRNGEADGSGGWIDQSHPAGDHDDGAAMYSRLTAHAILQSSGLTGWSIPEFDMCIWEPSGSYVEVWSSAGPITTLREARNETALGVGFEHWTDVFGWQINGVPASRAELVQGRVRIFAETGLFGATDVISFGEGGATGAVKFPEDLYAQTYKNWPIVDVGAERIDGIGVRPLPSATVLANTLVASAPSFVAGPSGPHFRDTVTLGPGVSSIQLALDVAMIVPSSGSRTLMTTTGNYLKLEVLPSGSLRVRVRDADGAVKVNNVQTASGVMTDLVRSRIVLSVDMSAGFVRIWLDGVQVMSEVFIPGSGLLPTNRILLLLATASGSYQVEGTIHQLTVWKSANSDSSDPAGGAYKSLGGPSAMVNADPWKLGADAT
ncbi:hypothetical protein BCF46_3222 [Litoreibacter meonggei]|uniref:Concanavalin A-like lectin/glucanase superfamily protein n=1 Tax=Litoreibacter meonggei TaxID=1049199 RepID=A0A497VTS5_9RHOB|nr:hypothetical protein [Litoreibacter meonggei]RLJ41429.1 hypothetical protein BCF46_3222 [Litoreibacter meonggei]